MRNSPDIMPCATHEIQDVRDTIAVILNIADKTAQLLVRDEFTIILLDCEIVGNSTLFLITEQFPNITITTVASEHSASGYIVIFTCMPTASLLTSAHTFQIAACLLIVLMCISSPLLSCWHVLL